jgi:hypothetical protein
VSLLGIQKKQTVSKLAPVRRIDSVMDRERALELQNIKIKTAANAIVAFEFYQSEIISNLFGRN